MENSAQKLKLNLGSGFVKKPGFKNVDVDEGCLPDFCVDLAKAKWPWENESVDEAVFEYSMEKMGFTPQDLAHVIRELYRVCAPGAKVSIVASHPRHDQFYLDPMSTQRISPDFFHLLSVSRNMQMISGGLHYDVLGLRWEVNFDVSRFKYLISTEFQRDMETGAITEAEIRRRMVHENNICQAFEVDLVVVKN